MLFLMKLFYCLYTMFKFLNIYKIVFLMFHHRLINF